MHKCDRACRLLDKRANRLMDHSARLMTTDTDQAKQAPWAAELLRTAVKNNQLASRVGTATSRPASCHTGTYRLLQR